MLRRWLGRLWSDRDTPKGWRRQNPSKTYKDFFAQAVATKLARGQAHSSLGGNLLRGTYEESGRRTFERLTKHGLKPGDTCVDYGCGTLRVGIHAIKYLGPGAYWGMDISDVLLDQGRKLVGDRLLQEKHPNFRVISPESVAEVAALKPAMVFSVKVLIHVHPTELAEYFQNLMKIIEPSGQAIITGKWSEHETTRLSDLSWAHSASEMQELVSKLGGTITVLKAKGSSGTNLTHGEICMLPVQARG
jgi:SAM-dependent methyltransferase